MMIVRTKTTSLFYEMFSNLTLKWIYPVMSVINLYSGYIFLSINSDPTKV